MGFNVLEIDSLCGQLYSSSDAGTRSSAQRQLESITQHEGNADGSFYLTILQESANQYSLMYCAQSMVVWYKANEKQFAADIKKDIVGAVITCAKRLKAIDAPKHIVAAIITCVAKITKLGCDKEPLLFSGVHEALRMAKAWEQPQSSESWEQGADPNTIARHKAQTVGLGLQLLNALVNEFNLYDSSKQQTYMNFATHRRCSNNFRDSTLLAVFLCSMSCLSELNPEEVNEDTRRKKQREAAGDPTPLQSVSVGMSAFADEVCNLVRNCLNYDFMAIIVDETEDTLSAQFPTSWKDALLTEHCQRLLWSQHSRLNYPHCATLVQALSSVCGIRRSFFDTVEEKVSFLDCSMREIAGVATIADDRLENAHYCNVVADACSRFVAPFGYKDLSQSPSFERWVNFCRDLSGTCFSAMFGQSGSFATTSTLLTFWGRLCNSKRMYLGDEDRLRDLETVVPQLAVTFFQGRTTPWEVDFDEELTEAVLTQADAFPSLILMDPKTTLEMIQHHLTNLGPNVLSTPASAGWLFYLAGSIVRSVFASVDETVAPQCSAFLHHVVECANHRRTQQSGYHDFVESGLLHFLTSVQLVLTSSRISTAVTKIVTHVFQEKAKLFHFILYSIGHNILRDPMTSIASIDAIQIVRSSIDLIGDACRDVPAAIMKDLRMDLPPIVTLPLASHLETYKLRTNLYAALWLLRSGDSYGTEVLTSFLQPVEDLMRQTCEGGMVEPLFVAGWLRDLRGVCRGTSNNQASFTDFVDWTLDHSTAFSTILQIRPVSPLIIVSLLRFLSELVTTSRYGKVNLPTSAHCASGIMLFKFICSVLQDLLAVAITEEQLRQVSQGFIPDGVYRYMLKPLMLSMEIMRKCLHGDFVPFGALQLYRDDVFDRTVVGMFRMLTVFPLDLFKQYHKTAFNVLDLLRSMTELQVVSPIATMTGEELLHTIQFTVFMANDVDTQTAALLYAMSFLSYVAQLVGSVKAIVTSPAMRPQDFGNSGPPNTVDRNMPKSSRRLRTAIARLLVPYSDLWTTLIQTAMTIVVCQDRALSICCGVVYPIFEADPSFWYQFTTDFLASLPERKRGAAEQALSELAAAAESQEKFFSEVFLFRNKLRNL